MPTPIGPRRAQSLDDHVQADSGEAAQSTPASTPVRGGAPGRPVIGQPVQSLLPKTGEAVARQIERDLKECKDDAKQTALAMIASALVARFPTNPWTGPLASKDDVKRLNETIHALDKCGKLDDLYKALKHAKGPAAKDALSKLEKGIYSGSESTINLWGAATKKVDAADKKKSPAGAIPFTENDPLPAGFAPARVVRDGSFRVHQGKVELRGIPGRDAAETALLQTAFAAIWERSTRHRVDRPGDFAELSSNGQMRLGTWRHPDTGETIHVAHWADIDDDSHVFYFRRLPGATRGFELAHEVFLS